MPTVSNLDQVLGALGVLIAWATPFVRSYMQAHVTPAKLGHVSDLARAAVRAAEQLGRDSETTTGAAKLNFASDMLVATSKRLGLKLTTDEVLGFVHAALREMKRVEVGLPTVAQAA